jgi:hypothetical protein
MLSDEEAVKNINKSLGEILHIVSPYDLFEPFVIQIRQDIGIPEIFRKYYPEGHYVLCQREGGMLNIHDPDGFPDLFFDAEFFNWDGQSAIIKTGASPKTEVHFATVIEYGFRLNKNAQYINDTYKRIFLQYATRNFICQTNKVASFLQECIPIPIDVEVKLESMFSDMVSGNFGNTEQMFVLDSKIWALLEDTWKSRS